MVKRIASKDTKNPRVPVDAAALVAEVSARNMFFLRGISAREREIFFSSRQDTVFPPVAHDEILSPDSMRLLLN